MCCLSTLIIAVGNLGLSCGFVNQQAFHQGHHPVHVTRLHRYDHSGLQSMLEAEARWMRDVAEAHRREESQKLSAGKVLKEVRHIRGATENRKQEASRAQRRNFVKLSEIQVSALQEHHRTWSSLLQTSDRQDKHAEAGAPVNDTESGYELRTGGLRQNGALLQRFKAKMKEYSGRTFRSNETPATPLTSLNSQYVGPIGVGTVVEPPGCIVSEQNHTRPLTLLSNNMSEQSSLYSKIGSYFWNQSAPAALSNQMSCTIKDQSKLWVVFDSGSTNLWVPSDLCKAEACRMPGRHLFNHSDSATFMYPESMVHLTVQFGTGKIKGPQARDDFHIGPFSVYNQTFAMIEDETGRVFMDVPFEGIVGLAFPQMSANRARPFFDTVIDQRALGEHNEFAFFLSKEHPTQNALFWGGVDHTFYKGDLEYFPVIDPYYWSLKLLTFKIGKTEVVGPEDTYQGFGENHGRKWTGPVAVVDTGTTFFTAEANKFQLVMDLLPAGLCEDITDASHPPLTIGLERADGQARDFILTHDQYMTKSGKDENARCSPAFMHIDLPVEHGPGIVLGEVFLRHYFAVFNRGSGGDDQAQLALAEAADEEPSLTTRLAALTKGQPIFGQDKKEPCANSLF